MEDVIYVPPGTTVFCINRRNTRKISHQPELRYGESEFILHSDNLNIGEAQIMTQSTQNRQVLLATIEVTLYTAEGKAINPIA